MKRIAILGAGGFAREVAWLIDEINAVTPTYEFLGFIMSDLSRLSEYDSKEQVLGDYSWLRENRDEVDAVAFGIGSPSSKLKVARELDAEFDWLEWPALIHPTVRFDRKSCHVGRGVVLCAGVIATVNVRFEEFSMVNLSCTIGHESVIGRAAVLNPTVNISGGVILEEGVMIGTGAQVLQYKRVGANSVVGGGAVVVKDVEPNVTVVGMPAKVLSRH